MTGSPVKTCWLIWAQFCSVREGSRSIVNCYRIPVWIHDRTNLPRLSGSNCIWKQFRKFLKKMFLSVQCFFVIHGKHYVKLFFYFHFLHKISSTFCLISKAERDRERFSSAPNGYNSKCWSRPRQEPAAQSRAPAWVAVPSTSAIICCLPWCTSAGLKWIASGVAET